VIFAVREDKYSRWPFFLPLWRCGPTRALTSSFLRFLDHTQRRITVGKTLLDGWSARRRDLYLTTHDIHNRQTSMPTVGFEPTIWAGERPQTYALDRADTGTGLRRPYLAQFFSGREMFGTKLIENIKTHILGPVTFFPWKLCLLWNKEEKYFRAGQATDDNMVHLSQYLTNLMHKICFTISFISCLYMFRARVLIIRRSKLHYTASGIITPIGVMIPEAV